MYLIILIWLGAGFIETVPGRPFISENEIITVSNPSKGVKIILKPGDLLFYRGCELEHWREPLEGESCSQVFLHYNRAKSEQGQQNINDRRPHLGLPSWFINK